MDVLRERRLELGLSQAELAAAAGVHLRQIRRYESGEQQPALAVAVRLAGALGISLDALAGIERDRLRLDGDWWAAWQLERETIAVRPIGLVQRGATVHVQALDGDRRAWHGELRLWGGRVLTGWYEDARSRGTMLFLLRDTRAEGRWAGLAQDGALATGHAALGRTRAIAETTLAGLIGIA
jgi:transcriptional regulator with XRE-family HTH domain